MTAYTAKGERTKYEKIWALPEYGKYSPGEHLVPTFVHWLHPKPGERLIDFGCGIGRASNLFHLIGLNVRVIDIAANCLDEEVDEDLKKIFIQACLWDDLSGLLPFIPAEYGYCCDVLEHIPLERMGAVLNNIAKHSKIGFFQVCFVDDTFGKKINDTLHLTVKPYSWWRDFLGSYGELVEARDLIENGLFVVKFNHA
jgi:2-polyprenyl-3-methyl-5-hydroxy-6-metoxy-1,4-benzoquinol methylase